MFSKVSTHWTYFHATKTKPPMRTRILLVLLLAPFFSFSQKMLESSDWCATRHKALMNNYLNQTDGRSDSIDLTHTSIRLDLLNAPQISAECRIALQAILPGQSSVRLDLEGLTVDSVLATDGSALAFSRSGPSLFVQLPVALAVGAPTEIRIHYHGQPVADASGWGGFYNQSGYTYVLGVGFAADPHSFGRAWFPCFDNFVERCSFRTTLITPLGKPGYANGALVGQSALPGGAVERTWELNEPIPSYLACFAAGPYTSFTRTYAGEAGAIPVEIAAAVADTNKVRNTFIHLPQAIEAFEYWFGPYVWNKIGYSLVPFNSGAMEHATNVAIMRAAIDGSLNFETLWAHELSHHWWGDLATCSTAEDMWLNEGWASYCEHLFTEKVYGQTAFRNAVRSNHLNVLQTAHVAEGGYRAVSGLPHDLTYGTHVYSKGASVAHNLRGYLGDSLFRVGCRAALAETQMSDWSSIQLRDKLENATGQNLHSFFDNWVFAGGYPDFSVDSVRLIFSPVDAPTMARVFVKQKLRGAPQFHHDVPLEFTFVMQNGTRQFRMAEVSGEASVAEFEFPAFGPIPEFVFLNTNLRLLQARSEGEKMLKTTGGHNFSDAKMTLTVNALGADSVFFRVEHHFAAPDNAGANPLALPLTNRYWSVAGDFPPSFDAQAAIFYDGRGQLDQLDTELFASTSTTETYLRPLYRPGPGHPWQVWSDYTQLTLGSLTDRYGQFRLQHILPGEYTFGVVATLEASVPNAPLGRVRLAPNPASDKVRIVAEEKFERARLVNAEGETLQTWSFDGSKSAELKVESFPTGNYWLLLSGARGTAVLPLVIAR
jgi:aminopeptidase N